jgi:glutamate racemase
LIRAGYGDVPVVGMEPAVKPAAAITGTAVIAVFATAATFQGRLFESVVNTHASEVEIVAIACPEWVELVEAGAWDGPEARAVIEGPVGIAVGEGADALVLGCTHFSYLTPAIQRAAGPTTSVVDPGPAVAAQTCRVAGIQEGSGATTILTTGETGPLDRVLRQIGIIESSGSALPLRL